MNILLVRQTAEYSYNALGVGIGIVGTLLGNAGHHIKIIDNNTLYKRYAINEFIKLIGKTKPDIIGFGIVTANAFLTYETIRNIKIKFPNILIVAGGLHMRYSSQEALEHGVDIVVNREGELVVVPLFDYLATASRNSFKSGLANIKGISFRRDDGTFHQPDEVPMTANLDDVPLINFNLFNIGDYSKTGKEPGFIYIIGQRGCPFQCTFCSDESQRADRRIASDEWLFRNVEHIYHTFGFTHIVFCDNNFTYPKRRAIDFCNRIIHSDLAGRIEFSCQTKVETPLDDELLSLMKRAGFVKIRLGLERLEPFSQNMIKKISPIEKVNRTLEKLKKHEFSIGVFMLIGFPFDTVELLRKEYAAFQEVSRYADQVICSILQPAPGTIYYDDYPKAKEWYLNPAHVLLWRSYFHNVFDTYMYAQIDMNFFDLDESTTDELKRIYLSVKEDNQGIYSFTVERSRLYRIAIGIDKGVANLSRLLFKISPEIEFKLFIKVNYLRMYFGTLLFSKK